MELPTIIPNLPHIQTSLFINVPVLVITLLVFLFVYLVITSVLVYHWSAYGMQSRGILVGESLFIVVSAVLFVVSGLAITYF